MLSNNMRTSLVRMGGTATTLKASIGGVASSSSVGHLISSSRSVALRRQLFHSGSVRRLPSFTPPPPPAASASETIKTNGANSSDVRTNVGRKTFVRSKPLPQVPNTLPYLAAFITLALTSWAGFTIYATNKEKLSSSIFKSVVSQVKNSPEISSLLSPSSSCTTPVLKRETWLGGMCRVKGSVNMMQGRVDLSFKIQSAIGDGEAGIATATVYFTSIRAHKHAPFEILRFLVVNDSTGESVSLLEKQGFKSIDVDSGDIV